MSKPADTTTPRSEMVRFVVDPRRHTPQEIADMMHAIRREARRARGLDD